jgi:hypothetical protein
MRNIICAGLVLFSVSTWAQNTEKELVKKTEEAVKVLQDTVHRGWKSKGTFTFLVNQASFSNWVAGGENNVAGTVGLNYDLNYKRKNLTWDTKVVGAYGLIKTKNADFEKKTDDRLEINSVLGTKAFGEWYYSFFVNFRTQFTKGFIYEKNADGREIRTENTNFFSPAYLTFGPGLFWKKNDNLKINLAPLTSKMTFVDRRYTSIPDYVKGSYFGVDANKSLRYELGLYASTYYKFNLMTNVAVENILNLYTNYLEDPKNVDMDYSLAIVMKVNKYVSANIAFQAIYDDNAFAGFQTRQIFGVGGTIGF